jgi:hypothetical protein
MTIYHSNGSPTSRRAITGAGLAQLRRRLSPAERACLAADIIDGRTALVALTAKAIATLVGVNLGYVDRALKLTSAQRQGVRAGDRPLILPQPRKPREPVDWGAIGDAELAEAISRIGVDRAINAAIAAERAVATSTAP